MNNRIRELSDIAYKNYLKNNPNSSFGRRSEYDNEFAKLIIEQCCQYLNDEAERLYSLCESQSLSKNYVEYIEFCAEKCRDNAIGIQEYFGVQPK